MKRSPTRLDYCQYLLLTPVNHTLTNFADHKENMSHDYCEKHKKAASSLPHRQLRKFFNNSKHKRASSLPHRQLRKSEPSDEPSSWSSLPHRQLRKSDLAVLAWTWRSLPHRQLRNELRLIDSCNRGSLPHRQLRNVKLPTSNLSSWFTAAQAA